MKIPSILALAALGSTLALAEDWTGKLLDSACYDRQMQQKKDKPADGCVATSQTSTFAIAVGTQVHKFDAGGNSQATAALRNRADRTAPGKDAPSGDITAKVTGTQSAGMLKVEKLEIQ